MARLMRPVSLQEQRRSGPKASQVSVWVAGQYCAVETVARVKDPEQQRRLMSIIVEDVERLDRLISDISDASRLDAELARQDATPVDLKHLLTDLVNISTQIRKNDKDVKISLQIDPASTGKSGFVVSGHDLRIGQVITNLLSNAIKFTEQGSVTVCCDLESEDDFMTIEIKDTGVGISNDGLTILFEAYKQVGEIQQRTRGTGLGLAISRAVVERHGGEIWATSSVGEGSTFFARLPRRGPPPASPEIPSTEEQDLDG